ncbi:MAG: aldehyde dehydrogenase [Bordetella sp. SCN 67-23]|nr:aldehyde dehydrogenase family protein [Burkholderiales bacterium]ODS72913.1 MAG: aldehyde dehydrogenase [Bordetella sp. SCN 67-23]ODU80971.1 MAG: aldehyde dehydrogenase [Bordetella sp. SCN 68-11]OJW93500.1 MAG: aldehyde dehydrogenase [Burkholderiales bacterium 67-32]
MSGPQLASEIVIPPSPALPAHRELYYGGQWQRPRGGYAPTWNPATGGSLGDCAEANAEDVDAAVQAARAAFPAWSRMRPIERAARMRRVAGVLREHAGELAMLDAANCGSPVAEMVRDAMLAAAQFDFFAGLVTEIKGDTMPMGEGMVNMSVREPYGVVGRIVAYNHPLMFTAAKSAAPLAAGNTVVMKPPVQAPLSAYRWMELIDGILPPGVLNVVTGGTECGAALAAHPDVPFVSLIGSVGTGRAVARAGAERLKRITLELGGKNACIVYPDADLERASSGAVAGMNFTWSGQSCGSTSRLFVHESVHDEVVARVLEKILHYRPGMPTDPATTMGAIVSQAQLDKIMRYIDIGIGEGATLAYGGKRPRDPELARGFFVEPTVFTGVTAGMRIANEEIFGPVLSVLKWSDEETLFEQVNAVEYGLTGAVFTRDLAQAHRAAGRIQSGFVWVNHAGPHFLGASYGGYKQSGIGRDESIEELLSYTQGKNINIVY